MEQRPDLNTSLDSQTFRQFYYLKEELVDFCKEKNIPLSFYYSRLAYLGIITYSNKDYLNSKEKI